MRVVRGWLVGAVLIVWLPTCTIAQEIPKVTPEGQKALDELLKACETDGGLNQTGEGPKMCLGVWMRTKFGGHWSSGKGFDTGIA